MSTQYIDMNLQFFKETDSHVEQEEVHQERDSIEEGQQEVCEKSYIFGSL